MMKRTTRGTGAPKVEQSYKLLRYLAESPVDEGDRLPPIQDLARELAISPAKLREQLEVARALGLVDVRPKTGIRRNDFSLRSALRVSLRYALAVDPASFEQLGELRNQIEVAFWYPAVRILREQDKRQLQELVDQAWAKLRGTPARIPHHEHRELHLTIYSRLQNPFVRGLLESYWDAYEAVGLNVYTELSYLQMVWTYHETMVRAITSGDFDTGYRVVVEHAGLLQDRVELDRFREAVHRASPSPAVEAERRLAQ
jgi:DNA-binding FadR family transcriptional regulator